MLTFRAGSIRHSRGAVAALCVLSLLGCSRNREKAPEKAIASAVVSAAPDPGEPIHAKLKAIVAGCSINVKLSIVSTCKNDEKVALVRDIQSGAVARTDALTVLVTALESGDKPLQTASAKILEATFRTNLGKLKSDQVEATLASRLLQAVLKLDSRQAVQAVPAAVHLAMLTQQSEMLLSALAAHPDVPVKVAAYAHLLRYGGVALLPKVEQLIATTEAPVAAAAVESLRRLPNQGEAEKARVCELVKGLVHDARAPVVAKAVSLLATCKGTYLDLAISEVEAKRKAGTLSGTLLRGLDQTCLDHRGDRYGTTAQCARIRTLLERMALDKKLDVEVRALSMLSLGLQFPDEKTRTLCKKFARDPSARLVTTADRVIQNVDQQLKRAPNPSDAQGNAPKPASSDK